MRLPIIYPDTNRLYLPEYAKLADLWVCHRFDPEQGLGSVDKRLYSNLHVIVLLHDQLYVIVNDHQSLRRGQYLVRNEWLGEELELDESLFLLYDDLGDMLAGSLHTKNKYRFIRVPRLQQLGSHARTVVCQSFAGPIKHATALEVEAFVLQNAARANDELREAFDRLYLMVSDEDRHGRPDRRRKTLMGEAVMNTVEDQLADIRDTSVLIESRIGVALERHKQIIGVLERLSMVLKNRLDSAIDMTRLGDYAWELEQEFRHLGVIVDRPYVHVVNHLIRELPEAAKLFRVEKGGNRAAINRPLEILKTGYLALQFVLAVYPRLFDLRLGLATLVDRKETLSDRDRGDYLAEISSIIRVVQRYNCDDRLQGAKQAAPVLQALESAEAHITDWDIVTAYLEIKHASKRAV